MSPNLARFRRGFLTVLSGKLKNLSKHPHLPLNNHIFDINRRIYFIKSLNSLFMFYIMFVLLKMELWKILSDVKSDVNQVTCPDL